MHRTCFPCHSRLLAGLLCAAAASLAGCAPCYTSYGIRSERQLESKESVPILLKAVADVEAGCETNLQAFLVLTRSEEVYKQHRTLISSPRPPSEASRPGWAARTTTSWTAWTRSPSSSPRRRKPGSTDVLKRPNVGICPSENTYMDLHACPSSA